MCSEWLVPVLVAGMVVERQCGIVFLWFLCCLEYYQSPSVAFEQVTNRPKSKQRRHRVTDQSIVHACALTAKLFPAICPMRLLTLVGMFGSVFRLWKKALRSLTCSESSERIR